MGQSGWAGLLASLLAIPASAHPFPNPSHAKAPPPIAACEPGRACEPLWPDRAPGAVGDASADRPFLTVYLPDSARNVPESSLAKRTAVIVCPGGAYGMLARAKEGAEPARWLSGLGICAFQLDYRVGPVYHHPVEMGDAARAVRWVRAHADRYHLDPARVGVLGFSAGGHLAATLATRFDPGDPRSADPAERLSDRPDFQILIYPVISMEAPFTHRASRTNLLGRHPDGAVLDSLSAEKHVTARTPPAFIVHAEADPIVAFANSQAYAEALRKAGVPVDFEAYVEGTHAFGLAQERTGEPGQAQLSAWPAHCAAWLRASGFLDPPQAAGPSAPK